MVYTRVYSSLPDRRYTLGMSTPRTRILLSSAYAPPRPYPRTMMISCVSPARGTYSHILPISMALGQKVNSPLITHSISNIPRASQRPYRERHSVLTESVTAFLPRASQRPYRERLSALTESVTAPLPRAPQRSYRERLSALTESVTTLLPRASQRSYRERLSALTESVTALLPRASQRSYRERHNALIEGALGVIITPLEGLSECV